MMPTSEAKCGFCKTVGKYWDVEGVANYYGFDCPICHLYFIVGSLYERIKERPIDNALLWCISENIKHNSTEYPVGASWHSTRETHLPALGSDIVIRRFEHYENLPIVHAEKPIELLKRLAAKIGNQGPFTRVCLGKSDLYLLKIADAAEALNWLKPLVSREFILSRELKTFFGLDNPDPTRVGIDAFPVQLTTSGWQKVAELTNSAASTSGFIAMSFGYAERNQLQGAITAACEAAGWTAKSIDQHEYVGGIVDAVIARINESRFVIADLTEHKNGVYLEAGYAIGKGIPVIFTIKDDPAETEKVHFDVQHLNQIRWKDYDDLKVKLTNRIKAILPR